VCVCAGVLAYMRVPFQAWHGCAYQYDCFSFLVLHITVTVTEAFVLCHLQEDQGCITESVRSLVSVEASNRNDFTMK